MPWASSANGWLRPSFQASGHTSSTSSPLRRPGEWCIDQVCQPGASWRCDAEVRSQGWRLRPTRAPRASSLCFGFQSGGMLTLHDMECPLFPIHSGHVVPGWSQPDIVTNTVAGRMRLIQWSHIHDARVGDLLSKLPHCHCFVDHVVCAGVLTFQCFPELSDPNCTFLGAQQFQEAEVFTSSSSLN